MTKQTRHPLWRAIVSDERGLRTFVLYAADADDAMDTAEYQTGADCVMVTELERERKAAA